MTDDTTTPAEIQRDTRESPPHPDQFTIDLTYSPPGADDQLTDVQDLAYKQSQQRDATISLVIGLQERTQHGDRWSAALVQPRFARLGGVVLTLNARTPQEAIEHARAALALMGELANAYGK